jgi:predicted signal transduction protein with EAL and GGDEF domain
MLGGLRKLCSGIQFRIVMLVCGLAFALLAAQLAADTVGMQREERGVRLDAALQAARHAAAQLDGAALKDPSAIRGRLVEAEQAADGAIALFLIDRTRKDLFPGETGAVPESAYVALREEATQFHFNEGFIDVAEPVWSDGKVVASLTARIQDPGFWSTLLPLAAQRMFLTAPILITGLLFAIGLASQFTVPLRHISRAADEFSGGNFEHKVDVEGTAEIRELGEAFNGMVGRLRENMGEIYELAYVDRVTQLPNRAFLHKEVTRAIHRCQRNGTSGALLFLDLDGFKQVNDHHGHETGDRLLAEFAERISHIVRVEDTVAWAPKSQEAGEADRQMLARHGGDEFTVLLGEIRTETDAAQVARRIVRAVGEPFVIDGAEVSVGASVGIATFPRNGSDVDTILRCADMAMYQAKEEGKNTFRFFSAELDHKARRRISIEAELRKALNAGELELHFQPKVDCNTGETVSVEALARWQHAEQGTIHPGEFIAIAEESGLIGQLGDWVLVSACRQIAELEAAGHRLRVSVNISLQQFERPDFPAQVLRIVRGQGIDASRLELEIDEAMAMNNPKRTLDHLRKLKRAGIRFSLDDFGAGQSSLAHLGHMPFDSIKIDRTFVSRIGELADPANERIVRALISIAKSLDCESVAEGVETEAQRRFLAREGCTHAQGYLFARPMPAVDLVAYLEPQRRVQAKRSRVEGETAA